MVGLGIPDQFTSVIATIAFWAAAVVSIVAASMMVISIKNMVRAALALTSVLACVAALFALLGGDFLAVVQLVVYIGAIMVLMVFAIMMTPGQVDTPGLVGRGQQLGAALVSIVIFVVTGFAILATPWSQQATPLSGPTTEALGGLMLSRYVLPFEIASLLLTVALVGAIVIARED
jgi:NADH-quinone oxidoreductase subunit J